nr:Chain AAA, Orb2A residues 1-9 MYNKFVNFI [Drosophila melanogaster]
MYNKFVNFI